MWTAAPWGVAALAGALMTRFALRIHTLQPDEVIPVAGSRYVLAHPFSALDPTMNLSGRGLERSLAVLFAVVQEISGDTARAFAVQHVLDALIFATVVPILAGWARDLGLARWQALAAGTVAVCVPWMVLGTSLLNSAPAYPLTALALWAIWRAIVAPGLARELIALAAVALLAVSRVGNVVVVAAWPLGIMVHALHDRAPGMGVLTAVRRLPRRVWRDHPLLVAGAALGLLAIAVAGTHWLVGGYPVRTPLGSTFRNFLRVLLAYLAMGTAVVPAILAVAWCARSLIRPADPGAAAFAALATGAYLAFAYVAATQGAEERYIAPLAPVLLLAAMVALARRSVGPVLVLAAGLVVARAIAVTGTGPDIGPYGYFAQSAQTFFRRVVLGKTSLAIPFTDHHVLSTVLAIAVVAAVAAVVLGRRLPVATYAVGAAAIAAYGVAAGVYSMNAFSKQAGYPNIRFEQQAWIDRAVGTGADVALAPQGLEGVQRELAIFNRALGSPYLPHRAALTVDARTGRLGGLPRYLLVQNGLTTTLGLTGDVVAASTYLPVTATLIRPAPLARWELTSARAVRVFATTANDCLTATVAAPAGTTANARFMLASRRGVLQGAIPQAFVVTLPPGRAAFDVRLRGGGSAVLIALDRGTCG